jgi:hypothetical protein
MTRLGMRAAWEPCSTLRGVALIAMSILAVTSGRAARAGEQPPSSGGPATFRRLNEIQYKQSIEDIFGADIKVPGRFEPPLRDEGLLAIGDSKVAISPSGVAQSELRAREIAAQVLGEERRKTILPCASQVSNTYDGPCAREFFSKYGRLLLRRPLADDELESLGNVTRAATEKTGDFGKGLQFGLVRLLVSPNFLFRVETTDADSNGGIAHHLDDYALATRLSFLLWDAPPDATLLDAAASGELRENSGLQKQVDRLIASPRFVIGMRAFFSDMFGYDQFDGLSKDQSLFPKYTSQLSKDAQEQTLLTVVDLLVIRQGDYRDLFTTKTTFLNRTLGSLYRVQVHDAAFGGWMPYTFSSSDPHAGILTLAAFLLLDPNHEGRSSPTIRGKTVRELFLCQKIPPPPGNVDFKLVQDTHNPMYRTARDRLTAHRDSPACAGCHSITDPIGLAMENYDAIGEYRTQENGALIDASGTFEGKRYQDVLGLEQLLHDSPAVPNCAVERAFEYGVGRPVVTGERGWLKYLDQRFADQGYSLPSLMRTIATSSAFQAVSDDTVALNQASSH